MDKRMNVVSRDMLMFGSSDNESYTRFYRSVKNAGDGDCYLYVFERPVLYLKMNHGKRLMIFISAPAR